VKRPSKAANVLLLLCTVAVSFIMLEIAARTILLRSGDRDRFLRYASARQLQSRPEFAAERLRFEPHRHLGYMPRRNFKRGDLTHNSLGYRDDEIAVPKPIGEFRIVCLGGSTTYTSGIEDTKQCYPNLLERELHERGYSNVNVINAGCDGWTSYETLINYELRVTELGPDAIIVMHGVNDIKARLVWPPSAFAGDNSGFRPAPPEDVFMPGVLEHSTLLRVVFIKAGWTKPHFDQRNSSRVTAADVFHGYEYERQRASGTYPSGLFEEVGIERMLAENDDRFYIRNVTNLVAMAEAGGVRVVLASIPYVQEDVMDGTGRPIRLDDAFLSALETSNQHLTELAERTNAVWFDLAADFPKNADLFVDGVHLNVEGAHLKARAFADYLIESSLLPST
jgi:lysophospholipase L1-like esterase